MLVLYHSHSSAFIVEGLLSLKLVSDVQLRRFHWTTIQWKHLFDVSLLPQRRLSEAYYIR